MFLEESTSVITSGFGSGVGSNLDSSFGFGLGTGLDRTDTGDFLSKTGDDSRGSGLDMDFTGSGCSTGFATDEGAFLLGPRARFFVMCVSWGPEPGSVPVFVGADTGPELEPLESLFAPEPAPGGPRASRPAKAGLNRSASALAPTFPCKRPGALVSLCSDGSGTGSGASTVVDRVKSTDSLVGSRFDVVEDILERLRVGVLNGLSDVA